MFSLLGSPFETGPQHFINHKCLYWPPKPTTDTPGFPSNPETCTGGLRAEVTFPSCWDGVNLDSADHKSHMAYPGPDGFWESGACPETHPVRLPTLFFEAIFRTHEVGMEAGDQLVYSFNDWSGYGFHGDFLHGWKEGVIEGFLDYCAYNDGSGPTQCGIVKDESSPKCIWEGSDDVDQYKVESVK